MIYSNTGTTLDTTSKSFNLIHESGIYLDIFLQLNIFRKLYFSNDELEKNNRQIKYVVNINE